MSQINGQIASNLELLQKQSGLYEEEPTTLLNNGVVNGVDLNGLAYQQNVPDAPLIISKAGIYIYLNAMVRHIKRRNLPVLIR